MSIFNLIHVYIDLPYMTIWSCYLLWRIPYWDQTQYNSSEVLQVKILGFVKRKKTVEYCRDSDGKSLRLYLPANLHLSYSPGQCWSSALTTAAVPAASQDPESVGQVLGGSGAMGGGG